MDEWNKKEWKNRSEWMKKIDQNEENRHQNRNKQILSWISYGNFPLSSFFRLSFNQTLLARDYLSTFDAMSLSPDALSPA